MKKVLFLVMCAVFLFSWELKKDQNGIQVYTQDVKNSKYDAFKAVMSVKGIPFEKVKNTLLDFKNYPKWQKKIDKIEVKDGYVLKVLDFPFPLSNRFAFYKISKNDQNGVFVLTMNSVPYNKLPEKIKKEFKKPDCVEMKDDVVFKAQKTKDGIKIIYQAEVDPNGAPAFIFNSKIISAGYETLNNLRKVLKK
ncbi:hypothetical protein C3L23_07690 [Nautilia sp. PV-1]|jgi:hypothetical protein|uniref:hypothetical protein n=1 Tax=Nautilia sp. PV-1 TaxID=2579250 RepID=UPI000FDB2FC8|nr:hypothetical protein [Nautilia sp. PV-1]AZV47158.1 hypothetical protein C3L23_07690 [Nautilia sp. PV-1]